MNMPGFTAETAVYKPSARFESERGNNLRQSGEVQPQLPPELASCKVTALKSSARVVSRSTTT
jgi:hypothetical protein